MEVSREVLMSLENSTHGLLTIFNELEGEQKECSKCEETSVREIKFALRTTSFLNGVNMTGSG